MENGKLLAIGFLLAVMYMTNAWDSLTYIMLTGLVLFYLQWERTQLAKTTNTTNNPILPITQLLRKNTANYVKHFLLKHSYIDLLIGLFASLFVIVISYLIFSLPFSAFFNPSQIVSGVGVLCSPKFLTDIGNIGPLLFEKDHCQKSPWWQLLTLYGFFYFFVISFLVFVFRMKKWARADSFVILLSLAATILIIIPEFFYMKDIYPAHYRANTMFKLVFQSFIMLSIASAYIIVRIISSMKYKVLSIKNIFYRSLTIILYALYFILTVVLLSLVLTYPFLATGSYYGNLQTYHGLDGLAYLKKSYPSDYEAIMWLQRNVVGQPVILEAQGDSYTDYGRISSNTGLPTVLGWTVHEWLWRGTYDIPAPRIGEIQTLYETEDLEEAKKLLSKYVVSYVVVGELETKKYPNTKEEKFALFGKKVFENGTTRIYKITTK